MIKNCKKISILGLIIIAIIACQKDDAIPEYNNFSDALATSGDKRIQRGDFASFADLSKGVTHRTWTIPESASIINLDGRDPSQIELIQVQFDESGQFEVNLKDEFINTAVVLDTTFNVTVLDYVQTNFDVISIDSSFYEETLTQITMYEGGTITFKDVSLGNPNRRKWTFQGGDPSSAGGISIEEDDDVSTISVTYPTIGTYDVELISWRQYPEGIADTLRLQNYINVTENIGPININDPCIYGFEDGGLGWDVAWQWDNVGEITYPTDNPASGQHSMKMEATSDARCRAYSKTPEAYFDLDSSKSYTIEFKIWIDTNYTDTNIFPEVFKSDQWLGEGFWTSVANLPRGEWVTVNKEAVKIWSPNESGQYFFSFRFQKIGVVYIDDIKIYEVE